MEYVLNILSLPDAGLRKVTDICLGGLRHLKDHIIPHARNDYRPHILGDRVLAGFAALLVVVKISVLVAVSVGPVLPAFSSAITPANIISLTNQSRTDYNLSGLSESTVLDTAAQSKADDMLAKGYFSHNTPDGKTPWNFITTAGYNYIMAGENLAVNFTEAENVETAWMNSPGHKANILNKNFEQIGIGISQGVYQGHEAIFVVQMFGTPVDQKVLITDTPTPVLTTSVPVPAAAPINQSGIKQIAGTKNILASPEAVPLSINNELITVKDGQTFVQAELSTSAVKAIAYFGNKAVMLEPKDNNLWQGQVALSELAKDSLQVRLKAFDMQGASVEKQLADFSNSTIHNYNILGATNTTQISWLGRTFNPKTVQDRFYLIFIAGLLTSMVLAIGLKRHIQHLNLIANSSFVVILATLLWFAG